MRDRQRRVIRTLVLVTVAFACCWAPTQAFYIIYVEEPNLISSDFYSITLLITFLNVCINPFIYSSSHLAVRKQLVSWFRCGKTHTSKVAAVQLVAAKGYFISLFRIFWLDLQNTEIWPISCFGTKTSQRPHPTAVRGQCVIAAQWRF